MTSKRRNWCLKGMACLAAQGFLLAAAQAQSPYATDHRLPPQTPRQASPYRTPTESRPPSFAAHASAGEVVTLTPLSISEPAAGEPPGVSPAAGAQPQFLPEPAERPPLIAEEDVSAASPRSYWLSADFLYWTASGARLPPLISASPPGTPRSQSGVLGTPGATVLFGNERVNDNLRPGIRVGAGTWISDAPGWGIEGSLFYLGPVDDAFAAGPPGIVSRPFISPGGQSNAELANLPGVVDGIVSAAADTNVWGGEVNVFRRVAWGTNYNVILFAGYRFLRLADSVAVNEDLLTTDPLGIVPPGTRFLIEDRFHTTNQFHGGALGLRGAYDLGRAQLRCYASVALGNVHETVDIAGSTRLTLPGQPTLALPGGFLAIETNSARFDRDHFAVMPAAGVSLAYQLTSRLQVSAGYNVLYLSHVTRPGNVMDVVVNPLLLPPAIGGGPARPTILSGGTDFWLHGLVLSAEWQF